MISIRGLKKRFGKKEVLSGLNLTVGDGELFAFIGTNGAGKTTTLRILSGLLSPDAGEVTVNGYDLCRQRREAKKQIGYMPDAFGTYDNLTIREYMEFFADIYQLPVREQKVRISELLQMVHLEQNAEQLVDTLSRGTKQKLCLARTLIHRPGILLLDEPASGLEPAARLELRQILQRLSGEGTTILISSHILSELSVFCTNIGIIDQGRILLQGSKEEVLRQANRNNPIEITVIQGVDTAMRLLKANPLIKQIARDQEVILVQLEGGRREEAAVLSYLVENGVQVASYKKREGDLESLFLKLTKG